MDKSALTKENKSEYKADRERSEREKPANTIPKFIPGDTHLKKVPYRTLCRQINEDTRYPETTIQHRPKSSKRN